MEHIRLCRPICPRVLFPFFAGPRFSRCTRRRPRRAQRGELFWICTQSSRSAPPIMTMSSATSTAQGLQAAVRERTSGILAALAEDDQRRMLWNPSFSHRALTPPASLTSSASPSSAPSTARMIPAVTKARQQSDLSFSVGSIRQQSAPMRIPVPAPPRVRKSNHWGVCAAESQGNDDYYGDEGFVPPHQIIDRAMSKASPMMTFSMLEGVGRTLKGRDLRRVRNAVLRQTGFLN